MSIESALYLYFSLSFKLSPYFDVDAFMRRRTISDGVKKCCNRAPQSNSTWCNALPVFKADSDGLIPSSKVAGVVPVSVVLSAVSVCSDSSINVLTFIWITSSSVSIDDTISTWVLFIVRLTGSVALTIGSSYVALYSLLSSTWHPTKGCRGYEKIGDDSHGNEICSTFSSFRKSNKDESCYDLPPSSAILFFCTVR